MENYEDMLNGAFEKVKCSDAGCGDRCEVKRVEGHVEGNKTIITNFMQIANCLRRDQGHFAKFLFKELAAPGEIAGERLILIKKISSPRIDEKIKLYADKYVFCPNCKKPDTELVQENDATFIRCLACGTKKQV